MTVYPIAAGSEQTASAAGLRVNGIRASSAVFAAGANPAATEATAITPKAPATTHSVATLPSVISFPLDGNANRVS